MTGRNDPCPCGSGKKYKHCCLGEQTFMESMGTPNAATEVLNRLTEQIGDKNLSLEELNTMAAGFMARQNEAPVDDFLGLSSGQMHHILHSPLFSAEDIVSLKDEAELDGDMISRVPAVRQALYLLEALGKSEKGLKATQTGNLPRALVQDFFVAFREDLPDYLSKPMSQADVPDLDLLAFALKEMGLIKIRTGWFSLTRKGQDISAPEKRVTLFCGLFRFYAASLDWLSTTGYGEENSIIQHALSFDLYLLRLKAGSYIHQGELAGLFVKAFPHGGDISRAFVYLFLEKFCRCFALTDREKTDDRRGLFQNYRYRRSDLFEHVFDWKI